MQQLAKALVILSSLSNNPFKSCDWPRKILTDLMISLWCILMAIGGVLAFGGLSLLVLLAKSHRKLKKSSLKRKFFVFNMGLLRVNSIF